MTRPTDIDTVVATNTGCAIQYDDLRDWLAAVEARGDLKIVTGADWRTDIGQVVEVITPYCPMCEEKPNHNGPPVTPDENGDALQRRLANDF